MSDLDPTFQSLEIGITQTKDRCACVTSHRLGESRSLVTWWSNYSGQGDKTYLSLMRSDTKACDLTGIQTAERHNKGKRQKHRKNKETNELVGLLLR